MSFFDRFRKTGQVESSPESGPEEIARPIRAVCARDNKEFTGTMEYVWRSDGQTIVNNGNGLGARLQAHHDEGKKTLSPDETCGQFRLYDRQSNRFMGEVRFTSDAEPMGYTT